MAHRAKSIRIPILGTKRTVGDAIAAMPELRSGISRGLDSPVAWKGGVVGAAKQLAEIHNIRNDKTLQDGFHSVAKRLKDGGPAQRTESRLPTGYGACNEDLMRWLERPELRAHA